MTGKSAHPPRMPQTLNNIADRLAVSGLLSVGEIATLLVETAGEPPLTPQQFVEKLMQRGVLTTFQAECILASRIEHLVFGNYVVLDKLGQGGMGLVLKARHQRMDRIVALKVLSPGTVRTTTAIERFQREVRAAAKLSHPNIVTAFDADAHHGTHFLVMEYVEGQTLSELVKQHGPLSVPQAIDCVRQAARGLEYAHQRGIIHRDIKPGNLMLVAGQIGDRPHVKILDLGLAHFETSLGAAANGEITSSGSVLGTIDYMAPEQALDAKQADTRSDIYSLGCTLYALLTGQPLYPGDTVMRRLLAHRNAPIPSLHGLVAEGRGLSVEQSPAGSIDPQLTVLDQIFSRMIAKEPQDRFQTMTEVLHAIGELQETLGTESIETWIPKTSHVSASGSSTSAIPGARHGWSSLEQPTVLWESGAAVDTPETAVREIPRTKYRQIGIVLTLVMVTVGFLTWLNRFRPLEPLGRDLNSHRNIEFTTVEPTAPQPAIVLIDAEQANATKNHPSQDHDRRVAEWVLKRNGMVHLNGQSSDYTAIADLPHETFKTTFVCFVDHESGLDDESLKNLLGLDSLKRFVLYDNHRVTDAGIALLKGLPSLEHLDLRDTRLSDDGLKLFIEFGQLESLVLMGNQFTDEGIGHLDGCKRLRTLQMRLPRMTDKALTGISGLLTRLESLEIGGSQVTDAGLAQLTGLSQIETLGLNSLAISDDGLKHLQGLRNLKVLNLAQTPISNDGLVHLQRLTNLVELVLNETQVTETDVAELQLALPKCVIRFK